ncbi:MAG: fibronectin type III domain-containing protein [Myxococcaceae bacterium]
MPVRLTNNPAPATTSTTPSTPAPAPATTTPAPAPVPTRWGPAGGTAVPANTNSSSFTAGNVPVRPPPVPVVPVPVRPDPFSTGPKVVPFDASKVLTNADKGTITERFDHAAATGMIKSGDVDELIRSMTATKLSDSDVTQLQSSFSKYSGNLAPADATKLSQFINREVPHLRHGDATGTQQAITNWDPPTTNTDGSQLNDLAGYKVHVGTQPGQYDTVIDVKDPSATGYVVDNLTAGPHYFMVTAYDSAGAESSPSNEASKVIP